MDDEFDEFGNPVETLGAGVGAFADPAATYGADVEVQLEDTDALKFTQAVVAPTGRNTARTAPLTGDTQLLYKRAFVRDLAAMTDSKRVVALVGDMHSGKTSLMDILIGPAFASGVVPARAFTDARVDERERKISLKSEVVSVALPSSLHKSYLTTWIDTPGHISFYDDEVATAHALADGVVLVVDVVEGVGLTTKRVAAQCAASRTPVVLVLTKLDRFVHELKLPPQDAYFKLANLIEEVNNLCGPHARLSPVRGNVLFASPKHEWVFSLASFAQNALSASSVKDDAVVSFARRLWGDVTYDSQTRTFRRKATKDAPTFVAFVLEPLYKLYGLVLASDAEIAAATFLEQGIRLTAEEMLLDAEDLLVCALDKFFNSSGHAARGVCVVDAVVDTVPSAASGAAKKLADSTRRPLGEAWGGEVAQPTARDDDALVVHCVSRVWDDAEGAFRAICRVLRGSLSVEDVVDVHTVDYEDRAADRVVRKVRPSQIHLCVGSRLSVPIETALTGDVVALSGGALVDGMARDCTLAAATDAAPTLMLPVIRSRPVRWMRIALEPRAPVDLPRLITALKNTQATYPSLEIGLEESGQRFVAAPSELYMDQALKDLRKLFSGGAGDLEIRVSEPFVPLRETVSAPSQMMCKASTTVQSGTFTVSAETTCAPLSTALANDLECGEFLPRDASQKKFVTRLKRNYGFGDMEATGLWGFGPTPLTGGNALMDARIMTDDIDVEEEGVVKRWALEGFRWATREGPLCDEPTRAVEIKLMNLVVDGGDGFLKSGSGGAKLLPVVRRASHQAMLVAKPRLQEPVVRIDAICSSRNQGSIARLLQKRRGYVDRHRTIRVEGSPFSRVVGFAPALDAFGLETDLRAWSRGSIFAYTTFHGWQNVPGDPMDASVVLAPLEVAQGEDLARDLLLKTRRRKGLSESVGLSKYFQDDPALLQAAHQILDAGRDDASSRGESSDDEEEDDSEDDASSDKIDESSDE